MSLREKMFVRESGGHFSASIKYYETFGSLLIENSVAALSASDGVSGPDLVLAVTLSANVDHGSLSLACLLVSLHSKV